jgi:hypothetical protein
METQCVEAQHVLRDGLAPARVGAGFHYLQPGRIARLVLLLEEEPRRALWILGTGVRALEDGAQRAFGGDRIALGKLPVSTCNG